MFPIACATLSTIQGESLGLGCPHLLVVAKLRHGHGDNVATDWATVFIHRVPEENGFVCMGVTLT